MTENTTPETTVQEQADAFDIDAWLQDAHAPERHVTIFQRGDLVGRLALIEDDLAALAQKAEEGQGEPLSAADVDPVEELNQYRRTLMRLLQDSALSLIVRAIPEEQRADMSREIYAGFDAKTASQDDKIDKDRALGNAWLAACIIGRTDAQGERHELALTPEQARRLVARIGAAQEQKIVSAIAASAAQAPEVDADFLRGL